MAMSDLPARDNKEPWAVKEGEGEIPHTERSDAHTALAELSLFSLSLSLLEPSIPLTLQLPPYRMDTPQHFSFLGVYLQIFWFKVNEAS